MTEATKLDHKTFADHLTRIIDVGDQIALAVALGELIRFIGPGITETAKNTGIAEQTLHLMSNGETSELSFENVKKIVDSCGLKLVAIARPATSVQAVH